MSLPSASARGKSSVAASASQSASPRVLRVRRTASSVITTRLSGSRKEPGSTRAVVTVAPSGGGTSLRFVVATAKAEETDEPGPEDLQADGGGGDAAQDDLEQHAARAGVDVMKEGRLQAADANKLSPGAGACARERPGPQRRRPRRKGTLLRSRRRRRRTPERRRRSGALRRQRRSRPRPRRFARPGSSASSQAARRPD